MRVTAPVSNAVLKELSEQVYRTSGIVLGSSRQSALERHVHRRMEALGQPSARGYAQQVSSGRQSEELQLLVEAMTVNETYFYRESHQFEIMSQVLLPERIREKPPGRPLRIWSMPCSTGEEPYSIAIWLLENFSQIDDVDIEIYGSDIDGDVLQRAKAGRYVEHSLRMLPDKVRRTYFRPDGREFRIQDDLRHCVSFTQVNVFDRRSAGRYRHMDIIFCRNMLIYFDAAGRRQVTSSLFECLDPGGYILLGHAESMATMSSLYRPVRALDSIVYRRPPE